MAFIHPKHSIEPQVFFGKTFIDLNLKPEPPFDIASLFKNGEQGLFYDPHTLDNSLVGQTVPTLTDLSSNENHGSNANSAQQMLLKIDAVTGYKYLKADGADDFYATQDVDFTHTDKVTVIAALRKTSDATAYPVVVEFGASATSIGSFHLFTRSTLQTGSGYVFSIVGASRVMNRTAISYDAPHSAVLTTTGDLSDLKATSAKQRVNGVDQETLPLDGTTTGGGYFSKYPLFVGRRGGVSNALSGDLYALLIIDRILTDAEIQKVEQEFAKRMGITV